MTAFKLPLLPAAALMSMLLAGCEWMTGSGSTDRLPAEAVEPLAACEVFPPIKWHSDWPDAALVQIKRHNAAWIGWGCQR